MVEQLLQQPTTAASPMRQLRRDTRGQMVEQLPQQPTTAASPMLEAMREREAHSSDEGRTFRKLDPGASDGCPYTGREGTTMKLEESPAVLRHLGRHLRRIRAAAELPPPPDPYALMM